MKYVRRIARHTFEIEDLRHPAPVEEIFHDEEIPLVFVARLRVAESDAVNAEDLGQSQRLRARDRALYVGEVTLGETVLEE